MERPFECAVAPLGFHVFWRCFNDRSSIILGRTDVERVTAPFRGVGAELGGGLDASEARRLKALEKENAKLKRMLADAMLDNVALKDLLGKKW
jgi:putative transposase